ncbi:MAG: hypothetical protein PWP07_257 [Epulopiscium sp.]|jgi:hypothetical protein|uniref:Uncharacterized protein n=1 Tax=Defluviitalea raffinosedens TaxID=1450156 RepID=A0A7C8LQ38_9FIRM|nr:hypothetical protein [Defluviitalea raffinosedens]KAE9634465.1 hypothetical protein GND95_07270 [Defluviitalea raffinosedens]MBM7684740.1 hypothetical protein [Defluviitalea raffinosedens]MBZ4668249.1 hypothetical protein [Defluviitaleaceae bacterium]MDK2787032.1 hypothetical protein [Candidatus Epulonipiscium sp.]
MRDGGCNKGKEKSIPQQLEAIREVLKNCCCGVLGKLSKIRGTCISVSQSANNLDNASPTITLDIEEDEVLLTKIHAAFIEFVEDPPALIDLGIITVRDREGNIVFQDGFGDNLTTIGVERYETTFVHPLLVKGPVNVELAFYSPEGGFDPVEKLGALTVVYCKKKDCVV